MAQSIFFDVIARDRASSTFSRVGKSSDVAHGRLKQFGRTAANLAGLVGVAGFGAGMVSFFKDANAEAREAQKVGALTNQVIKSTGGVAGVTAAHVGDLANAISKKAGIDDEAIQSGENLLLTFKNVRNEVGQGNAVFDRATRAAVNLSAAGFGSLSSASKMVGKALNDPTKGLTALGRAGVTFTKGQQDQIKKLVETGQVLKAQKIILKEVESQVGGAAAAQATAGDKARVAWKNLEEQIGTALLPTVDRLANFTANDLVPAVSQFVTGMQDGTGAGGDFVDVLHDVEAVGKTALRVLDAIPGPVKKFGVEGLIAFAAYRKLTGVMGSFSASMVTPIARTKQFYAEMTYAETRLQKVGTASRALGGALTNLAGVGGMLLVADGARKSSTAMGGLELAAGGVLSGAALGAFGGPPGAAIGAALGGLTGGSIALYRALNKSKGAAEISLPSWKTYAQTLDGVAASTTKATRAMVLDRLEKSGALKAMIQLGLTERQSVNAVLGQAGARLKLAEALRHSRGLTDQQKAALIAETGAVAKSRLEQLQHNVALAGNREELQKARKALAEFMASPAAKKVTLDTSQAQAAASALSRGLREALGLTRDLNTAGRGGIGTLLKAPTGKGGKGGKGGGGSPRLMEDAGRSAGESYARGVDKSRSKVKKALDKYTGLASQAADRLSSLKDIQSGFASTFASDNLFGVDLSGGGGLSALLDFGQKQASQAEQLMRDIQTVAGMGLSKSLISQLQSQGTSGAQALHALAGGSAAQIAQFNALDAQTQSSLQSAGMLAGNIVRGGSIESDVAKAAVEDARLERLVAKLRKAQGDDVVIINIDSEEIIKVIKKRNRRKGVASAGI